MNTTKIVTGLVSIVLVAIGIILFQTFRVKRVNTLYVMNPFNLCFVVDQNYQVIPTSSGFDYLAGKNKGIVTLERRGEFSPDMTKGKINGIDYAYQKLKNYRVFEYKLDDQYILKDYFLYKKRAPVHITLYRNDCSNMKTLYETKTLDLKERK